MKKKLIVLALGSLLSTALMAANDNPYAEGSINPKEDPVDNVVVNFQSLVNPPKTAEVPNPSPYTWEEGKSVIDNNFNAIKETVDVIRDQLYDSGADHVAINSLKKNKVSNETYADDQKALQDQLTKRNNKVDESINKIKQDIKTANDQIETVTETAGDNKFEIKMLKQNKLGVDVYEEQQKLVNDKLDKQIADEKAHSRIFKKQINENAKAIEQHSNEIQDLVNQKLNTQVANERFEQVEQRMDSFESRMDRQDKRFRRAMASQYAMAGLFQPYNVGRINVSAAIGGYKSEQAIAIGAGYRINNNLAVKAGVATNLNSSDGAGYNIGMNYEF